jgi:hypothetical protein
MSTDLGEHDGGGGRPETGDLIDAFDRLGERDDHLLDHGVELGDVGVEGVDPGEHLGQQEPVVVGEVPGERLLQPVDLGAHPAAGQLCEHLRVVLAGDQRGHHLPPRHPEDVAGHHRQLDLGVLEKLLRPLLLRGSCLDQVDPVAGHITQPTDLQRGNETRADHLPLGELAQPHRVQLVGLGPAG